MPSVHGEAPWFRMSSARTVRPSASLRAIDCQLRAEPNRPCRMISEGPKIIKFRLFLSSWPISCRTGTNLWLDASKFKLLKRSLDTPMTPQATCHAAMNKHPGTVILRNSTGNFRDGVRR